MTPSARSAPRVLICHERFLFRFGADRVFIIIAERLKALGCHVTMLAARFDRERLEEFADVVYTLPMPGVYHRADEFCSRWLRQNFAPKAKAEGGYDLIIHGGWPLFGATVDMRELAPRVLFLDCGVVPEAGYPPATQAVLRLLHKLRRQNLRACTHAAGISRFIVETQTQPDVGPAIAARVLLLGADHLTVPVKLAAPESALEQVRHLARQGHPLMLNLGRYEAGTYKNSQISLAMFHLVRSALPGARLLVLEEPKNLRLPAYLARGVEPIGFPSDDALAEIIRLVNLGVSLSLWEGYNLPLVELLCNGTPALALKVGAHAEVVPDPWFLCTNSEQMAAKAVTILEDPQVARQKLASATAGSHWQKLVWDRFMEELITLVALPFEAPVPRQP